MTPERLREIASNCEDTSFIASEDNANELRELAEHTKAITQVIERIDRMRAAWPDFRNRVGYVKSTQDLEALCRKLVTMPAKPYRAAAK
jgi:phosphoribosylaminoimidazole carboxylase (NCAIR synthetase)